ncbi:hypothetical protein B0H14DRAFT_2904331 [Mycena olivaceomarginata]|nr:hypothetical protein B0H14DRAFT_2904331 [Mycena olivaceomarginata]
MVLWHWPVLLFFYGKKAWSRSSMRSFPRTFGSKEQTGFYFIRVEWNRKRGTKSRDRPSCLARVSSYTKSPSFKSRQSWRIRVLVASCRLLLLRYRQGFKRFRTQGAWIIGQISSGACDWGTFWPNCGERPFRKTALPARPYYHYLNADDYGRYSCLPRRRNCSHSLSRCRHSLGPPMNVAVIFA